jgi:hypothetical protein
MIYSRQMCTFIVIVSSSSPSAIIYVSSLRILHTYLPTSIFEYYIILYYIRIHLYVQYVYHIGCCIVSHCMHPCN